MKKLFFILNCSFCILNYSFAQPAIQWQKCLGGDTLDKAGSIIQTSDGAYMVAGQTWSNNGDVTGNHGLSDYWVVKLSPYVGIEEEKDNGTFRIFPNPFTIQTTINFTKEVHNATFSLYNLLGEKMKEISGINGESFQVNRGNLPSGVYVFEVIEKEKSICRGRAMVH